MDNMALAQALAPLPAPLPPRPAAGQLTLIAPTSASGRSPAVIVPPINFAMVAPGIYRSGHPNKKNFGFLRGLDLKGIMYVEGTEEYRKDSMDFVQWEGMRLHRYDLSKESALFTPAGRQAITAALRVLLDKTQHPILVHDDSGKSTSTLLVSLIRRMQGWSLTGVYAEGDMFSGPAGGSEGGGVGEAGREYIALFEPRKFKYDRSTKPDWLD